MDDIPVILVCILHEYNSSCSKYNYINLFTHVVESDISCCLKI